MQQRPVHSSAGASSLCYQLEGRRDEGDCGIRTRRTRRQSRATGAWMGPIGMVIQRVVCCSYHVRLGDGHVSSGLHSSIARELHFCSRDVVDEPVNDAGPGLNVNGRKQWHPFLNGDHLRHQLGFASSSSDECNHRSRDVSSIGCSHSGD